jgi:hypothetical protein
MGSRNSVTAGDHPLTPCARRRPREQPGSTRQPAAWQLTVFHRLSKLSREEEEALCRSFGGSPPAERKNEMLNVTLLKGKQSKVHEIRIAVS